MLRVLAFATVFGCCTVMAGWTSPGRAEDGQPPQGGDPAALFEKLDSNKDGKITEDELPEDQRRLFDRLRRNGDKDSDGALSQAEFAESLKTPPPPAGGPGLGGPGLGGPGGADVDPAQLFERGDQNKDGKLVADELPEERRPMFERLVQGGDADKDGALSKEEFVNAFKAMRELANQGGERFRRMLKEADKNNDGQLSREEAPPRLAENFDQLDGNKDGQLDQTELQQMFRRGQGQGAGPGAGLEGFRRRLKEADKDNDGKLSREEAPPRLKQNFDAADANKDGFIDQPEMEQMLQKFQGRPNDRKPEPAAADQPTDKVNDAAPENKPGERPRRRPGAGKGQPGKGQPGKGQPGKGQPGKGLRDRLKEADKNNDGQLSREEAFGPFQKNFDTIDANQDNQLDQAEIRKFGEDRRGQNKGRPGQERRKRPGADQPKPNNDVQNNAAPNNAAPNNAAPNNAVNKAAAAEQLEQRAACKKSTAKKAAARKAQKLAAAKKGKKGKNRGDKFKKLDQNNDGVVSRDEAPPKLAKKFSKLDKNNNGVLERGELAKGKGKKGKKNKLVAIA